MASNNNVSERPWVPFTVTKDICRGISPRPRGSGCSPGRHLLDQLLDLQTKTVDILRRAESAGDLRTAIAAIAQARQNLELLGRMTGALQTASVNVLVLPEWVGLRSAIVRALDPYPEAKGAVVRAIEGASRA